MQNLNEIKPIDVSPSIDDIIGTPENPKDYTPEQSSNVRQIAYDYDALEMHITFDSGKYKYSGVPLAVYIEATKAESIGKFFAARIKRESAYKCQKVDAAQKENISQETVLIP